MATQIAFCTVGEYASGTPVACVQAHAVSSVETCSPSQAVWVTQSAASSNGHFARIETDVPVYVSFASYPSALRSGNGTPPLLVSAGCERFFSVNAGDYAGITSAAAAPVAGSFGSTGYSQPFAPLAGKAFNISIWGTFVGTVKLVRSFDGGLTWLPLTASGTALEVFTAPVSEQWQEDGSGVLYALLCSAYTSGAINYRISQ